MHTNQVSTDTLFKHIETVLLQLICVINKTMNRTIVDGSLLTLEDAWKIFNDLSPKQDNTMQRNMLNILSQMEHPVLFRPFLTLHPCRIAEVLRTLPHSQNKVLSFLSIYGPTIYLDFDLEYAKYLNLDQEFCD